MSRKSEVIRHVCYTLLGVVGAVATFVLRPQPGDHIGLLLGALALLGSLYLIAAEGGALFYAAVDPSDEEVRSQ